MIDVANTDALTLLSSLEDNSVDLIITDPPYPVISGGRGDETSPSGVLEKNDGKIFEHNDIHISEWIYECYRVLKEETHLYIMINFYNLYEYMSEIQKANFKIHNLLVWEKNNVTPSRWYMKNCEYTIFARKGKAKQINNNGSKTVHSYTNPQNKLHPTQKPIELMQLYIENSSNKGDLVLDPFYGSGSTAIACVKTDRQFIGAEMDEQYRNIATTRIQENTHISSLFEGC